ncbi:MAG: hypothetical protein A3K60_02185 [Euryarchaeota archaeon RBG_19FT_COMBO_56_21]|nr:MAG: hypothetical protein A3K60_02185 [Euryarchaeota archaeon RBG_19FT_COMBO_56_21]
MLTGTVATEETMKIAAAQTRSTESVLAYLLEADVDLRPSDRDLMFMQLAEDPMSRVARASIWRGSIPEPLPSIPVLSLLFFMLSSS